MLLVKSCMQNALGHSARGLQGARSILCKSGHLIGTSGCVYIVCDDSGDVLQYGGLQGRATDVMAHVHHPSQTLAIKLSAMSVCWHVLMEKAS